MPQRIEHRYFLAMQVASIWLEGYILGTLLNYMVEKDPVAEAHKAQVIREFIFPHIFSILEQELLF